MTRIDPQQLLSTLGVLLAPDGGIGSAKEMPRIVKLMTKFSKKLVSKCIYIHILRSSSPELLELFLSMDGWELLNTWFVDAIKSGNYYLCGDLVKLFALCPMTAARLKEFENQAPKLIKQLSCDPRIEGEIRNLSRQVMQQWGRVAGLGVVPEPVPQATRRPDSPLDLHNIPDFDADFSEDYVPPQKAKQRSKPAKPAAAKRANNNNNKQKVSRSRIILQSDSESEPDEPRRKTQRLESVESNSGRSESSRQSTAGGENKDDSDVDDLLGSDSEEETKKRTTGTVNTSNTEAAKKIDRKRIVDLTERNKAARARDREREKRRREELERNRQKEKERREQRAKPYSRTELRMELESEQKDKIKRIAAQLKEQNKGKSMTAGLGRIPKLPKKDPPPSFDAVLGAMDVKPKVVKAPPMKNKNKDLLETMAGAKADKPRSKLELEKERLEREEALLDKRKVEDQERLEREKKEQEEREKKEQEEREKKEQEEKERKEQEEKEREEREEKERKEEEERKEQERLEAERIEQEKEAEKKKEEERKQERERRREARRKEKDEKRRKEREERKKSEESNKSSSRPEKKLEKSRSRILQRSDSSSSDSSLAEKRGESKQERREGKSEKKEGKPKAEKRSAEESPKPEKKVVKKSPSVLKESNMFGDVLSSIMKDDKPRPKKRRLSEIKAEREAKELAKQKEKEAEAERLKQQKAAEERLSGETKENSSSPNHVPESSEEKDGDLTDKEPKKVKGILVFARYLKQKKRIRWQPDSKLVQVEYFELDETERTNVWKQKTFEEMRKQELNMEKSKLKSGCPEINEKPWTLVPLDVQPPVEYGSESTEKDIQRERESKTLPPLYFNNELPQDPTEPDLAPKSDNKPLPIPQIDRNVKDPEESVTDYSADGWTSVPPPASTNSAVSAVPATQPPVSEPQQIQDEKKPVERIHEILSTFKPGVLENIVNLANNFNVGKPAAVTTTSTTAVVTDTVSSPKLNVSPPREESEPMKPAVPGQQNKAERVVHSPDIEPKPLPQGLPTFPEKPHLHHQNGYAHGVDNHRENDYSRPPPNFQHNNRGYNNGHRSRGGGGHRRDRYHSRGRGGPYSHAAGGRPCKFWMESGNCNRGDQCSFAHPNPHPQY